MHSPARLALLALGLLALAHPLGAEAPRDPYPWLGRSPAREPVYPEILLTPRQLAALPVAARPLALDLRPGGAFAQGHLPGARPLDLEAPLAAAIAAGEAAPLATWLGTQGIGATTPLLLYADGLGLPAIGRAFWALEWAGCASPRVLAGGIEAWLRQGGELETAPAPAAAFVPPPTPRPALGVGPDWIAARLGDTHACEILDLRGEAAWAGPAGHIPHALALDLPLLLGAGEDWPAPAAARQAFSRFGPRPRDFVDLEATFVLAGADAADPAPGLAYLLLRLIDVKATVQLGGWAAWQADSTLPTTRILDTAAMQTLLAAGNPDLADRRQARLPLFDLRGHRDFQREHLPGAIALPAHVVDDSLAALIASHWPAAAPAVDSLAFYCYGAECVRSRIAASKAARLGWRRTLIYQDGVPAWRRAGLPLPGHGPRPSAPIPAAKAR
jgi:thiosulfate/3-mercaptopyruvate sulfurtransferase